MKKLSLFTLMVILAIQGYCQSWEMADMFTAPNVKDEDRFGDVLFQNERWLVVGSKGRDSNSGTPVINRVGCAYLFEKSATGFWVQKQSFYAPTAFQVEDATFPDAAALFSDYLVLSNGNSSQSPYQSSGAVFIYKMGSNGLFSTNPQIIQSPDPEDDGFFGISLALLDGYLCVGCSGDRHGQGSAELSGAGSVHLYTLSASGVWEFNGKLTAPVAQAEARFGFSIAAVTNRLVVGSPFYKKTESATVSAGQVYYYEYESMQIPRGWKLKTTIANPVDSDPGCFGFDLAYDGQTLAVGAPYASLDENGSNYVKEAGLIYVLRKNLFTSAWSVSDKLVSRHRAIFNNFGWNLALSGDFIAVGCSSDETNLYGTDRIESAGAVYLYSNKSGDWLFLQKLLSPVRNEYEFFGLSVVISGGELTVGESYSEDYFYKRGAVVCYRYNPALSVFEIAQSPQPVLYPNPVSSNLNLDLQQLPDHARIRVFSLQGKVLVQQELAGQKSVISMSHLPPGVYLVEVINGVNNSTHRILKQLAD